MAVRVLLADDHRILRAGLAEILDADADITVVGEAEDGRATVRRAAELRPDVVVMDVAMPDLNGVEATRQVVALDAGIHVLALSMHADGRYVKGMLQAGARGYLLKDCASDELLLAVRTVSAGRIYVSPSVAGVVVEDYVAHLDGRASPDAAVLTARERQVLQLIAEGCTNQGVGERLNVSVKTVESHRKRLSDKLGLRSVAALTKYAIRHGLTSLEG